MEPALLPKALEAAKEVGLPESSIHILEGRVEGRESFQDLITNVKQRGLQRIPPKPAKKGTLAYLIFSSGTAGLPKGSQRYLDREGVLLTYRQLSCALMVISGPQFT